MTLNKMYTVHNNNNNVHIYVTSYMPLTEQKNKILDDRLQRRWKQMSMVGHPGTQFQIVQYSKEI